MPNIASAFKSEVSRVARKEVRVETQALKKSAATYRSDIAALKRRTATLEQQLRGLLKPNGKATSLASASAPSEVTPSKTGRFSAKGFKAMRQRLGLSVTNAARLLQTSPQSIYNWEDGKIRPRAAYLPAITALKAMGKKEVAERVAALA